MIPGAPLRIVPGTRIDHYEIVGWLGAGGMGVVYRARDPRLGRDVAIKVMPETFAADGTRLHRFEQEAGAAGSSITRTSWRSTISVFTAARLTSSRNSSRANRSAAGCMPGPCRRAGRSIMRARRRRGLPPRTSGTSSIAT